MGTTLFIIDPQNDFIDNSYAALPVPGAHDDMMRLGDFVAFHGHQVNKIVVALDQHPYHHIAHPVMWIDEHGAHPEPFTRISHADIQAGRWRASVQHNEVIQHKYVEEVEAAGSVLTIWPPHCIIGSWGASVQSRLCWDLKQWADASRHVLFFPKSGNWSTEQYSSFEAIVPRFDDRSTMFNGRLYEAIDDDLVLIAGEALSHCVAASVRDAINHDPYSKLAERMILLTDCTSPVTGCTAMAEAFVDEFVEAGGRIARSTEVLPNTYAC